MTSHTQSLGGIKAKNSHARFVIVLDEFTVIRADQVYVSALHSCWLRKAQEALIRGQNILFSAHGSRVAAEKFARLIRTLSHEEVAYQPKTSFHDFSVLVPSNSPSWIEYDAPTDGQIEYLVRQLGKIMKINPDYEIPFVPSTRQDAEYLKGQFRTELQIFQIGLSSAVARCHQSVQPETTCFRRW